MLSDVDVIVLAVALVPVEQEDMGVDAIIFCRLRAVIGGVV